MRQGIKMLTLLVALGALALVPAAASAADFEVGIPPNLNEWTPDAVTADVGDQGTWILSPLSDGSPLGTTHDVWICTEDTNYCGPGAESDPGYVDHRPACAGYTGIPIGECEDGNDPKLTVTFDNPGTFTYICSQHPGTMFGTLQVGDTTPPPPAKFKLSIKPKKGSVKAGKTQKVSVTVKNTGAVDATGVKVCPSVPKKLVKKVKCKSLGSIAAGSKKVAKFKIKTQKKVKGKAKLKFKTTGSGVKTVTGKFTLKIKK